MMRRAEFPHPLDHLPRPGNRETRSGLFSHGAGRQKKEEEHG